VRSCSGVGRADVALRWNIALLFVYPAALWFGSQRGPNGRAISLFVTSAVLLIPGWRWLVFPYTGWRALHFARAAFVPVVVAAAAWASASSVCEPVSAAWWRLTLSIAIAVTAYIGLGWSIFDWRGTR